MMSRRSPRAHNGDGRKTVACCAATHGSRVCRYVRPEGRMALIGDDHVN